MSRRHMQSKKKLHNIPTSELPAVPKVSPETSKRMSEEAYRTSRLVRNKLNGTFNKGNENTEHKLKEDLENAVRKIHAILGIIERIPKYKQSPTYESNNVYRTTFDNLLEANSEGINTKGLLGRLDDIIIPLIKHLIYTYEENKRVKSDFRTALKLFEDFAQQLRERLMLY